MTLTAGRSLQDLMRALRPRNRLAEYCELRDDAGLFPQFAAVYAGIRPAMDCWIPNRNRDAFVRFVEELGLSQRADCAFRRLAGERLEKAVGGETLCTTKAEGIPLRDAGPDDEVHFFVGRGSSGAARLQETGWYPVVVEDRMFPKPFIDHLEFGRRLGYPECCISFFADCNDWNRTNSYFEASRRTVRFRHLANCFGKNAGFSMNFHLPCRFDCRATIRQSGRLMEYLMREEPEYAAAAERLLRMPVLALNEREVIVLDGAPADGGFAYSTAADLFSVPSDVMRAIEGGDRLEIHGRFIRVLRGRELVGVFECRTDEFGPRVPMLVTWQ